MCSCGFRPVGRLGSTGWATLGGSCCELGWESPNGWPPASCAWPLRVLCLGSVSSPGALPARWAQAGCTCQVAAGSQDTESGVTGLVRGRATPGAGGAGLPRSVGRSSQGPTHRQEGSRTQAPASWRRAGHVREPGVGMVEPASLKVHLPQHPNHMGRRPARSMVESSSFLPFLILATSSSAGLSWLLHWLRCLGQLP